VTLPLDPIMFQWGNLLPTSSGGHRHLATTEIYADYAPDPAYGAKFHEDAFTAKPVAEPVNDAEEDQTDKDPAAGENSKLDEAA
jgi:hypothetical protein